jgi:hypothetical protein
VSSELTSPPGQTEALETNGAGDTEDFLARERALLGDDADQFATPNDHTAVVEDANDDLLDGGEYQRTTAASDEISGFESSFPAIDTQNEVCSSWPWHSQICIAS